MSSEHISPIVEEAQAIDRIARTHDGRLLHRYLRRVLESCRVTEENGALQRQEGARILAQDLMRHMADGIEGTSERRDESILGRGGQPVGPDRRHRGTARRVDPDERADQFVRDNDPGAA